MHTKGPWKLKEVVTSVGRAFKINEPTKIDDDHGCVACIYDDSTSLNLRPSEEHEANARLIAAAPELLDELMVSIERGIKLGYSCEGQFELYKNITGEEYVEEYHRRKAKGE